MDRASDLVLGATGTVGRHVLAQLRRTAADWLAVSRHAAPVQAGRRWRQADLFRDDFACTAHTLYSCGPLDGLVHWLHRPQPKHLAHLVALSSTSAHTKTGSQDPQERDLAARLCESEQRLQAWCTAHGTVWTVLRPTLIYDPHAFAPDVATLLRYARRYRIIVLPAHARGLRQPVCAEDVATAMRAATRSVAARNQALDLPGGRTMPYADMIRCILRAAGVRACVARIPSRWHASLLAWLQRRGRMRGLTPVIVARMGQNLCFDAQPARQILGFAPR